MKSYFRSIFALTLLLSVYAVAPAFAQDRPTHLRTIEVIGEGEVGVVPNEVVLNLGIETTDPSLEKAKAENDKRVQQVLRTLRESGIEERLIRTANINIEPQYDYRESGRVFLGFLVRRTITATVKDITRLDDITSKIVTAGITSIFNYEYRSSEEKKYMNDARTKAITSAKEKAQGIARDLGLTVVKAYSVIEENENGPFNPVVNRRAVLSSSAQPMDESSFSLGEIILHSTVRVIFEVQ